jgi:anti-sigma B factor antagonist
LEKLKTSTRQVEGVTIVDLSGRITLGEASVVVRDVINDLMGKGNKKILLNLVEVNYIDSSGIGVLVSSFSTVRSQGGELKLVNLSKRIRDLLRSPSCTASSTSRTTRPQPLPYTTVVKTATYCEPSQQGRRRFRIRHRFTASRASRKSKLTAQDAKPGGGRLGTL